MFRIVILLFVLFSVVVAEPVRVVSLGPAITRQMMLLGVDTLLVGKTSYCPPEAGDSLRKPAIIGDLIHLNSESILKLKPTVVLAGGLTAPHVIEQLTRFSVNVVTLDDPADFDELCENVRAIALATQCAPRADSLLSSVRAEYKTIRHERKPDEKLPTIFIQLSVSPLYTAMKNTLGNELIESAGAMNCFSLEGGAQVNREAVLMANPDLILIPGMDGDLSAKERMRWLETKGLSAANNQAVYLMDANEIGSPTPVSFLETVRTLSRLVADLP